MGTNKGKDKDKDKGKVTPYTAIDRYITQKGRDVCWEEISLLGTKYGWNTKLIIEEVKDSTGFVVEVLGRVKKGPYSPNQLLKVLDQF